MCIRMTEMNESRSIAALNHSHSSCRREQPLPNPKWRRCWSTLHSTRSLARTHKQVRDKGEWTSSQTGCKRAQDPGDKTKTMDRWRACGRTGDADCLPPHRTPCPMQTTRVPARSQGLFRLAFPQSQSSRGRTLRHSGVRRRTRTR